MKTPTLNPDWETLKGCDAMEKWGPKQPIYQVWDDEDWEPVTPGGYVNSMLYRRRLPDVEREHFIM